MDFYWVSVFFLGSILWQISGMETKVYLKEEKILFLHPKGLNASILAAALISVSAES